MQPSAASSHPNAHESHLRLDSTRFAGQDMQSDDRWQNVTDQLSARCTGESEDEFQVRNADGNERGNEHDDRRENDECTSRDDVTFAEE